jgi:hypothetical protein
MFPVTEKNTVTLLRRSPRLRSIVASPLTLPKSSIIESEECIETIEYCKTPERKNKEIITPSAPIKINKFFDRLLIRLHYHTKRALGIRSICYGRSYYEMREIRIIFELFNDNMEALTRLNGYYDSTNPLSNKPYRFDIMFRELFWLSETLIKDIHLKKCEGITPFEDELNSKVLSVMNVTRENYFKFRHLHFDD